MPNLWGRLASALLLTLLLVDNVTAATVTLGQASHTAQVSNFSGVLDTSFKIGAGPLSTTAAIANGTADYQGSPQTGVSSVGSTVSQSSDGVTISMTTAVSGFWTKSGSFQYTGYLFPLDGVAMLDRG